MSVTLKGFSELIKLKDRPSILDQWGSNSKRAISTSLVTRHSTILVIAAKPGNAAKYHSLKWD